MLKHINGFVVLAMALAVFLAGCNDNDSDDSAPTCRTAAGNTSCSFRKGVVEAMSTVKELAPPAPAADKLSIVTTNEHGILVDVDGVYIQNSTTGVITNIKPDLIKSGHWKDGNLLNVDVFSEPLKINKVNATLTMGKTSTLPAAINAYYSVPDGTILPDGHMVMNGCRTCWIIHGWNK